MTSRKPLQSNENRRGLTAMQSSYASINHLSRHSDALRRFQLPSHKTDASDASIKNQPIQQSMIRTSRLNRPKPTKPASKQVISAKSWADQDREEQHRQQQDQQERQERQEQQEQENGLDPPILRTYAKQQETEEQLYFYSPKQQTRSQQSERFPLLDPLPLTDIDIQHQQTRQNIEWDQGDDDTLFFTVSRAETNIDRTAISLKRQHPESVQQTRLATNDQQGLQPLTIPFSFSSPTSTMSPSPPSKRLHGLGFRPPAPLDTESQQNIPPPMAPFHFNTTSTRSCPPSSPSTYHLQTSPDTENQPHQPLRPLTKLQLFTESSSPTPLPSSNLAYGEFEQLRHTTSNLPPPLPPAHLDDTTGDSQPGKMKLRAMMLTRSWANRWEDLSQDLSELRQEASLPRLLDHPLLLSPVYNLNDDCLTEILKWCATTETLYQVSLVCKHWRNVALQPYVWRTINYTWVNFVQQLAPMSSLVGGWRARSNISNSNNNNDPLLSSPLVHIRTITLDNTQNSTSRLCGTPTSSIFTNLCTLQLAAMHFKDILDLIAWTKHLKELDCKHILTVDSNDMVMITPFSTLRHLRLLKLHFASMCELIGPTSLSSITETAGQTTSNRWNFSPKLRILKITNTYDIEEFLTCGNSASIMSIANEQQQLQQQHPNMTAARMEELVQSWNAMENTLMHKYRVFTSLGRLTNLSLGYCTGYTARIWRECVLPATKHLKKLTLCGWNGDGHREAPMAWKERHDMAHMTNTSMALYTEDVEMALAEMLAGLHHLESLTLIQFKCTNGVINGMEHLTEATGKSFSCQSLQATMNPDATSGITRDTSSMGSTASLKDLRDWHLLKCKLKFSFGASVVRTLPGNKLVK